jgi:hypothetical protein
MRKQIVIALAGVTLFVLVFLVTCQKSQKPEQIQEVTFSKNFKSSLTDADIWFQYSYTFHNVSNNQQIASKKEIVESYYGDLLVRTETTKHEIYFKWVLISTAPLQFQLTGYITPPQTKEPANKGLNILNMPDPPETPKPPPPET